MGRSIFDRAARNLGTQPKVAVNYKKAITRASAPTIIEPEVADRLIDFVVDESALLSQIRTERMNTNVKHLRFVDISQGLLRPGGCATDDTDCDHGTVTGTAKQLSTHEMKAVIPICDDILEDNVEGAAFESHVLQMVAKELANEIEIWALMSDTAGSYTTPIVNAATMLLNDGFYQQLQGGNVLDGSTAASGRYITLCKIIEMAQRLPTKYRRNNSIKLFMPDDMWWDLTAILTQRGTPLGDDTIKNGNSVMNPFKRFPIEPLALIPVDVLNCASGSAPSPGSFMFASDPKNLVWGIQRDITFERERKGCQGRTYMIWTLRVDALIENEEATVLYDCMDVQNCEDCGCL